MNKLDNNWKQCFNLYWKYQHKVYRIFWYHVLLAAIIFNLAESTHVSKNIIVSSLFAISAFLFYRELLYLYKIGKIQSESKGMEPKNPPIYFTRAWANNLMRLFLKLILFGFATFLTLDQ